MCAMSPRLLRPLASFDPRQIAGLSFWLDANAASTVDTVSDNVSEWRSRVNPSLKATQGTAANRPAYTTAGRNGRNVVTFDGLESSSGDFLTTGNIGITQPFTVFWVGESVGRAGGAAPSETPHLFDSVGSTNRAVVVWNPNATIAENGKLAMFAGTVLSAAAGPQAYNEGWNVITAVFNGASSRLRINGSQVASGNAGANQSTQLTLGARFNNVSAVNDFFEGDWGEFLVYAGSLTDAQCQATERYLGRLWSIAIS